MRFAFIATHRPNRAPGQRFRFEQYLNDLQHRGITCDYLWLFNARDDEQFYRRGNVHKKGFIAAKSLAKRLLQTAPPRARKYDLIFVHKSALFFGGPWIESIIARSGAPFVFDFDDAIWVSDVSEANRMFGWLKRSDKVPRVISMADLVIAGNRYLAGYANQYNSRTTIVPTTIDTDEYRPDPQSYDSDRSSVCIGWSGSFSTTHHLDTALPALTEIKARFGDKVRFKVIGDPTYEVSDLGIRGIPWQKKTELADLRDIDIGIMPLADHVWAHGKCGLKGLQYMALEIPTIMSPIGVNSEIIEDGVNGFLASTHSEWVNRLSELIDDPDRRVQIGRAGRLTVKQRYSFAAWRDFYYDILYSTAKSPESPDTRCGFSVI